MRITEQMIAGYRAGDLLGFVPLDGPPLSAAGEAS